MILLDTHIWLWLLHNPSQLSQAAQAAIESEESRSKTLISSCDPIIFRSANWSGTPGRARGHRPYNRIQIWILRIAKKVRKRVPINKKECYFTGICSENF